MKTPKQTARILSSRAQLAAKDFARFVPIGPAEAVHRSFKTLAQVYLHIENPQGFCIVSENVHHLKEYRSMALVAKTSDGKMPPRNANSWRAGLLEEDLADLKKAAKEGSPTAQKRLEMLKSLTHRPR